MAILAGSMGCNKDKPVEPKPDPITPLPGAYHSYPKWSPNGDRIIFKNGEAINDTVPTTKYCGLFFVDTNGTNCVPFLIGVDNNAFSAIESPSWFPDGQWVAFEMYLDIYIIKINGDSLTRLTYTAGCAEPVVSPDGSKILFFGYGYGDSTGLWVMNSDGSNSSYVIRYSSKGTWEMDNVHIITTKSAIGAGGEDLGTNFLRINTITRDSSFIVRTPYFCRYLSVNPIYNLIIYDSQENSGKLPQVWSMNIDGTNQVRLTGGTDQITAGGMYPDCSPDGNYIVYTNCDGANDGHIWIMNRDGTNKRQLTKLMYSK